MYRGIRFVWFLVLVVDVDFFHSGFPRDARVLEFT